MKRILFICNHLQYSDGVAICLKNLVNALSEKYEIDILNLYKYNKEFAKDVVNKVKIYNYFGRYFKGLRTLTNKCLLGYISKSKVFRENKYDIIISYQYGTPSNLIDYLKEHNIQPQAKTIGVIHGFAQDQLKYYKNLDAMLSISEDGKNEAEKYLPEYKGKLVHIRNIYNVNNIKEKSVEENALISKLKSEGKLIYCTVSRLTSEKGIERFIQALSSYHKENPKAIGIIVGDGPEFDGLNNMIIKIKAEKFILLVGSQVNPYPFINGCDYYCCTSRSEGLCTSCVEAAILKKPIISTDVSGAKEIIFEPCIGCVVPNNDDSFLGGIKEMESKIIGDKSFEESCNKWDPETNLDCYVQLIESL